MKSIFLKTIVLNIFILQMAYGQENTLNKDITKENSREADVKEFHKKLSKFINLDTTVKTSPKISTNAKKGEIDGLRVFYATMTEIEKSKINPWIQRFLSQKEVKPNEKTPSVHEMEDWLNKARYQIVLDEKIIDNNLLFKYKPKDFHTFFVTSIPKNDVFYGDFELRVNIFTPEYYKNLE